MKKLILTLSILFIYFSTYSQNPEWINYYPSQNIYSVATEQDYVWICSSGGLERIEIATNVKTLFNSSNSGLPNKIVSTVSVDQSGNKWIGTYGGNLVKYDGTNWTIFNSANSGLPNKKITSIVMDNSSNLWIGTDGGGLVKYDGTSWIVYDTTNSGLPVNGVTSIVVDSVDNVWIGTHPDFWSGYNKGGGLAKFDRTNWTVYTIFNSNLISNYITSIAIDQSGLLWIGTFPDFVRTYSYISGLVRFDGTNWYTYRKSNSGLPSDFVSSIKIDENNHKWIGTTEGGLARFTGTGWTKYNANNSGLPYNYVTSIALDNFGNKWVGTYQGLTKFDGTNWTSFGTGLSGGVDRVTVDKNNIKWLGSNGLVRFDGTNWRSYNTSNSVLTANSVYAIETDNYGNLWVGLGSHQGGLFKFNGTNWSVYKTHNSGLPHNWVNSIAIDEIGDVWVGTLQGLAKFNGVNWTNTYLPFSATTNTISAVTVCVNGNIWVGAQEGGGLAKYDGINWTVYNTNNSGIPSGFVSSITSDSIGNIYIGTKKEDPPFFGHGNGGLVKFDGNNWTVYNDTNSGLPAGNWIECLTIDNSGTLWIGNKMGLAKFDGNNWTVYNVTNSGLPINIIHSIDVDKYGNKWIGTYSGLTVFNEGGVVSIHEEKTGYFVLENYFLSQNYPNPFNPVTKIKFTIPQTDSPLLGGARGGLVTLKVYDIVGREIATLINEAKQPGNYEVEFNAEGLSSGVYYYQLKSGSFIETKKMMVLK